MTLLLLGVAVGLPGCYGTKADEPSSGTSAEKMNADHDGSATRITQTTAVASDNDLGAISTPKIVARLAEQAEDLDPLSDGWETEALSNAANRQLTALAGLLEHPNQFDAAQLAELTAQDFSCGALRAERVQETFRDQVIRIERGVIDVAAVRQQSSGPHRGIDGLVTALATTLEPLHEATDVHVKFKLFNIEASGGSFTTRQYFSASGRTATGMVEQNATWLIRWVRPSATAPPKIAWIGVEAFEQVTTRTSGGPLFADVTEAVIGANAAYREQLSYGTDYWLERAERLLVRLTGYHGLAVGDVNGDGLEDVYVCQAGGFPNLLFVQQQDGTVREMAAAGGVDILDFTHAALLVDLDNDGDQDLVVGTSPQLLILANNGRGQFTLRARAPVLRESHSLSAADYDGDGDLDIYGCRYFADKAETNGLPRPFSYHDAQNGGANVLLRNDLDPASQRGWAFKDVTVEVGLDENNRRWSFAAAWEDYDNDGDLDIYVANDVGRNNLYRNDGGRFTDVAPAAGVEDGAFGMSVTWGDYNHDGLMDLYVANMFSAAGNRITFQDQFLKETTDQMRTKIQFIARGNSLYENLGDGTFRDVSVEAGVTMGRWSWGSVFADVNNDSWEDLLVGNGYLTRDSTDDL